MGVYIKGMEMPKNCGECLLAKLSPTGESLICNYMLSRVSWEERPFDCPLVPIPPHGDLIDRDDKHKYIAFGGAHGGGRKWFEGAMLAIKENLKKSTEIEAEGEE